MWFLKQATTTTISDRQHQAFYDIWEIISYPFWIRWLWLMWFSCSNAWNVVRPIHVPIITQIKNLWRASDIRRKFWSFTLKWMNHRRYEFIPICYLFSLWLLWLFHLMDLQGLGDELLRGSSWFGFLMDIIFHASIIRFHTIGLILSVDRISSSIQPISSTISTASSCSSPNGWVNRCFSRNCLSWSSKFWDIVVVSKMTGI